MLSVLIHIIVICYCPSIFIFYFYLNVPNFEINGISQICVTNPCDLILVVLNCKQH